MGRKPIEVLTWQPMDSAPHGIWLWARDAYGEEFKAIFHAGIWQSGSFRAVGEPVEWLVGWRNLPLKAYWSRRENDVMLDFPRSCDGHWLSGIFDSKFIAELERRGYDTATLRFEVKSKPITRRA